MTATQTESSVLPLEVRTPDPTRPFVAVSNRHRWGRCALSAVLPQVRTPSGPAAQEGTEAHKLAEWELCAAVYAGWAQSHPRPAIRPPAGLHDFDYSEAGITAWQQQVDDHAHTYGLNAAALFSDSRANLQAWAEYKIENVAIHGVRVYTIADAVLWNPHVKRLVVGDYKFGRAPVGVGTAADPNPQCAAAAVLIAREAPHWPIEQIGLFVYQPRAYAGEPWQVLAPLGRDWLAAESAKLDAELAAVARAASERAQGRDVAPTPGDHCKYCPSARWCPAAAEFGHTAVAVETGRVAVVDLTPEQIMSLWGARKAFKEFEADLAERVRMLADAADPAVKVQRRAGRTVWANPAGAVEALMLHDRFDLLQPPGIEKAREAGLSAEDIAALTTRSPDVLTYLPSAGKDPAGAVDAFAKYLRKES